MLQHKETYESRTCVSKIGEAGGYISLIPFTIHHVYVEQKTSLNLQTALANPPSSLITLSAVKFACLYMALLILQFNQYLKFCISSQLICYVLR